MSRRKVNRDTETPPLTSEGEGDREGEAAKSPTNSMTDVLMLMEEQRREDRERDSRR